MFNKSSNTIWHTTSPKYKDIISNSVLIQSGSPSLYQLKPKKETIGTLTRKCFGETNLVKENKTILLVGETGAGKSTLINTLLNHMIGVKFEDNIWFEIVGEQKRGQSESQTSDVIVYQIFSFEDQTLPYSLTIIDTPGFGDTRGIEHDVIISQRLLDLFRSEDGVHEINAVGLVMKATDNRLSDRLKYIYDSVVSLFGNDMQEKIVTLITHSNGMPPKDVLVALEAANLKCAKNEKNQCVYFLFDNCQFTERTEETEFGLENTWRVTKRGTDQFIGHLKETSPQKLVTTVDVLNSRIRLTACINNLQERIKMIEGQEREIQQIEEALKKYEQEMDKNKNFTVKVDEVYKDKVTIEGGMKWLMFYQGAVCCTVCEENCHFPGCTMAWYPGHCEVMKDGRCTVCTGKCPVSAHVKENWRFVTKTREVQRTEKEMKEKFEKNKGESENKLSLLENLEEKKEELIKEKNQLVEEAYEHVIILEHIALNVNSLSTYVHLDFLIEKMNEKGETNKAEKLRNREKQMDEETKTKLYYVFCKMTGRTLKK